MDTWRNRIRTVVAIYLDFLDGVKKLVSLHGVAAFPFGVASPCLGVTSPCLGDILSLH
jgi:hypothetical protein